ncbi:MAG: Ig-like domain-containing protein [Granulosicoccaceae bacterium]
MLPLTHSLVLTSTLCMLALTACQSSNTAPNVAQRGLIELEVSEKSLVEIQARSSGDKYWLSYEKLPTGWYISTDIQDSPHFSFQAGPVSRDTVVFLDLHQTIDDPEEESITRIQLAVSAVEEPPVASGEEFAVIKGRLVTHAELPESDLSNLLLNDRDEPEDNSPSARLTVELVSPPKYAETFELGTRGGWQYRTWSDASASRDSFRYRVSDGQHISEPVTVTLNLQNSGDNSAPVAVDACHVVQQPSLGYNGNLAVQVTDSDDSVLNYRVTQQPTQGSLELELSTGAFRYIPSTTERGYKDSFSYEVSDLRGGTDTGNFTLVVGERRVMALGDSITLGVESTSDTSGDRPSEANSTGYRKALKDQLLAQGYSFDYVGPLRAGYSAGLSDAEHAGYSGWRAGELASGRPSQPEQGNITNWLNDHPVDIVLLHAGTNDHSADASALTPLLNELQDWSLSHNPSMQFFVASIIDQRRDQTDRNYLAPFNAGVEALVPSYQPNAIYVDQFSALNWRTDITDYTIGITGLHPNSDGYLKMANVWADALLAARALNKCP